MLDSLNTMLTALCLGDQVLVPIDDPIRLERRWFTGLELNNLLVYVKPPPLSDNNINEKLEELVDHALQNRPPE